MTADDPLVQDCQKRVGTMLGAKWRLDALIGVGGMAAVYAGTHRNGARAAIKVLHAEFAGHQEVRARFLREAYIANKVEHSGTVKVLDDDISEGGEPYIVMELLVGESVETRAKRNGGWLRYPEVLSIVEQTLAVLENAHAAGVVHRDLKPDNLFLSTKGEVKVLDFGIARLHDAAQTKRTQEGMMMGTPAFMAPEQALGKWGEVDGRTDLWSVGAIFLTLLSGRTVHEGQTDNELLIRAATRPAPSLARVVPKAPVEVVRVVDRALAFEQSKRFADATSFRVAVRALMAAANVPAWGGAATAPAGAPSPAPSMPAAAPVPPKAPAAPPVPDAGFVGSALPPPAAGGLPSPFAVAATAIGMPPAHPLAQAPGGLSVPAGPAASPPPQAPGVRGARREDQDPGTFDAAYATDDDLAAMRELFLEVERALIAKTQYGPGHPEARRRADRAFRVCASALMRSEYGLVWNITPYAFVARDEIVWEPERPLDRIPYQLFADGVRLLGLVNGLDDEEFRAFFGLLTLDRATEVAPEDDFATLLWDASFSHVVHQVVDTFADGNQEQRLKFREDTDRVVQLAHFDTEESLAESWTARQETREAPAAAEKQQRILAHLSAGPTDTEARARVADMVVRTGGGAGLSVDASVLKVDDALRTTLVARLTMETSALSERFARSVARAFELELGHGNAASVTTQLRSAIDGLAAETPELAIDMVGSLCREVGRFAEAPEAERLRAALAGSIVSSKMIASVLTGVKSQGGNRDVYAKGLRTILGYSDGTHFSVVLADLGAILDQELRDVLVDYLARTGAGREAELGNLFEKVSLELGLALVRVLAAMKTAAAREAIAHAAKSPHAVVRIEALGHVEGVSSERLRLELRALVEDREPGVRLAALEAMEQYGIRVAGPFLVLRVRSEAFDGLPVGERRQALATIASLAPNRAESVALEIANDRRLVASGEHEVSRELAVDLLARVATGEEAKTALSELATARLRNSDRVRAAAQRALDAVAARKVTASAARTPDRARAPAPAKVGS